MTVYVESSALAKLLLAEQETAALASHLSARVSKEQPPATAYLTETELRRFAIREGIGQQHVTKLLDRVQLLELDPAVFRSAGILEGRSLRSLDALHVAVALRVDAREFISYDERQLAAAKQSGLNVCSPC